MADPVRADRRRRRRRGARCSAAAASAARRRSTRRSRCARTRRTTRSGTRRAGSSAPGGAPFGASDLDPHYDRVEQRLGVRERTDWRKSVRTVEPAFRALGAPLEPVTSYTDANCMSCGSCLQGCPTNAGKSTLNTYIHDAWAAGRLELRADARVERVVIEDGEATGVEYVDGDGALHACRRGRGRRRRRDAEHAAAPAALGAAGQPEQPARRPQPRLPPGAPRLRAVRRAAGRAHGVPDHRARDGAPARRGRRVRDRGDDDAGSDRLRDDASRTRTGRSGATPLVETLRGFRRWIGVLAMVNDDNNGSVHRRRERRRVVRRGVHATPSASAWTARSTSPATCSGRRAPRASAGPG